MGIEPSCRAVTRHEISSTFRELKLAWQSGRWLGNVQCLVNVYSITVINFLLAVNRNAVAEPSRRSAGSQSRVGAPWDGALHVRQRQRHLSARRTDCYQAQRR